MSFSIMFSQNALPYILEWMSIFCILIPNICMLFINKEDKKTCFYFFILILFSMEDIINKVISENSSVDEIDKITFSILIIILLIIINIYNIKNKKGKKSIFVPIICTVLAIISIFIVLSEIVAYTLVKKIILIVCIIIFIVLIVKNKFDNESNNKLKIGIANCIIAVILIVATKMGFYVLENNAVETIEKIQEYVKNNSTNENVILIPVCKNNKWGYIDNNGNMIIDCKYDLASAMLKTKFENDENSVNIGVVQDGEKYKLISSKGDSIWEFNVNEILMDTTNENDTLIASISTVIGMMISNIIDTPLTVDLTYSDYLKSDEYVVPYNVANIESDGSYNVNSNKLNYNIKPSSSSKSHKEEVLSMRNATKLYKEYNEINNIVQITYQNQILEKEIELYPEEADGEELNSEENTVIKTFSDGYLPYYNLDEKIQGYYDSNFELKTINGNYQILDIREDIIIIREFDEENETTKVFTVNMQNGETQEYKEIQSIENGYLVKKMNDKAVVMDTKFNEVSNEYDFVLPDYIGAGILIGIDEENKKFDILNNKGEKLVDDSFGNMLFLFRDLSDLEEYNLNYYGKYLLNSVYEK